MHIRYSNNNIFEIKFIIFKAYFINKSNLKNALTIIHLIKNHYRNIWNNWANILAEIFLLSSCDKVGK
jgi:hypothetical protein